MMILDKKVSVILMKKGNEGRYLSKLNKKAINILTEAFGGATITSTSGTWADNGKVYKDKSYIVSCNYAKKLTSTQLGAFLTVVKMEFLEGKQLSVSVVLGQSLYILDRSDLKQLENVFVNNLK